MCCSVLPWAHQEVAETMLPPATCDTSTLLLYQTLMTRHTTISTQYGFFLHALHAHQGSHYHWLAPNQNTMSILCHSFGSFAAVLYACDRLLMPVMVLYQRAMHHRILHMLCCSVRTCTGFYDSRFCQDAICMLITPMALLHMVFPSATGCRCCPMQIHQVC